MTNLRSALLAGTLLLAACARTATLPNQYHHEHLRYTINWPDGWESRLPEDARYGVQYLTATGAPGVDVQLLYVSTPRLQPEKLQAVADSLAERNPATRTLVSEQALELTGGAGLQREYTGLAAEVPCRSLARFVSTVDGLFILIGKAPATGGDAAWAQVGEILASFSHDSLGEGGGAVYAGPAGPSPAPQTPSPTTAPAYTITIPEGWTSEPGEGTAGRLLRLGGGANLSVELGSASMGALTQEQLQQIAAALSIANPLLATRITESELRVHEGIGRAVAYSGRSGDTPYRTLMHLISRGANLYIVIGAAPDTVTDADWHTVVDTVRSFTPTQPGGD